MVGKKPLNRIMKKIIIVLGLLCASVCYGQNWNEDNSFEYGGYTFRDESEDYYFPHNGEYGKAYICFEDIDLYLIKAFNKKYGKYIYNVKTYNEFKNRVENSFDRVEYNFIIEENGREYAYCFYFNEFASVISYYDDIINFQHYSGIIEASICVVTDITAIKEHNAALYKEVKQIRANGNRKINNYMKII